MTGPFRTTTSRILNHLPGWMFLASGLTIIGMSILTPTWLQCRQLQWQHDIMLIQSQRLGQQLQSYRQFHQALQSQDPVLVERMAYHQMHLKPVGSHIFDGVDTNNHQTVEGWLHTPLPRVGVDYPALKATPSRLVRLATGQTRLPLLGAGILSVTAALVWVAGGIKPSPRYRRT